jgi:DNA repair exonuclease SbcCD ATPase subunit
MPASFALATDCQLFRKDVEGVLTLAARLLVSSSSSNGNASSNGNGTTAEPSATTASSSCLAAGPLIGAVLTEANVRSLLLNTLVRVLVPTQRQAALLHDNKYVQMADAAAKKNRLEHQQEQQQPQNHNMNSSARKTGASFPLSEDEGLQPQQYRVGRVVGVVPKPGAKGSTAASATTVDVSQRWLLAVYVGECVEPFTIAAISDDVFTATEHRIFVQSALSTNRDEGSRRASVLPSQQPALLSAEAAATVQAAIADLRRVLEVVDAVVAKNDERTSETETAAAAKVNACRDEVMQRASGAKRPREGKDDLTTTTATTAEHSSDGATPLSTFFGHGAASQAARLARLTDDVTARGQQLQQLRKLLQQKDQEVKSTLQQQQQMEARHRAEVDVWRAKVEEQSREQERTAKEVAEALEQRDRLLEEANTKLRRLAGMATKYKQVVDTVATQLKRSSSGDDGGSAGTPMSPDEILAALRQTPLV